MARQLSFIKPQTLEHGGEVAIGKRKSRRPFDPKRSLHVVLRSTRARGKWSFLHHRNESRVETICYQAAEASQVKIYNVANVGNHLHLLLKAPNREALQRFLRSASGRLAMAITGACKGNPVGRFWDRLAYSRVVAWGRDFNNLKLYFVKNLFEAAGFLTSRMKAAGVRPIRLSWLAAPSATGPPGAR